MYKTIESLIVFLATILVSALISELFFELVIDAFVVPIVGLRPVLAAINVVFFVTIFYKLVDSKYHFEQKNRMLKYYKRNKPKRRNSHQK